MVKVFFTYLLLTFCVVSIAQDITVKPVQAKLKGTVFSPSYFREHIMVCSDQFGRLAPQVSDGSGHATYDMYFLTDTLGNYEAFDDLFRSEFNDGPASFNADGSYMVFSQNSDIKKKLSYYQKEQNLMSLFYSEFNVSGWSRGRKMSFVDDNYSYTHPGLSKDGKTLVFASDLKGGFGGFDIWISRKNGDSWSTPVNAGANVNSAANELFPSLDGRSIYFSSDRKGKGGLDIYAYDTLRKMSNIMDAPINSIFDDFGLITADGESNGYFSTNRSGQDEVWSFHQNKMKAVECVEMVANNLCYGLAEEQAEEFGDVQGLVYQWNINDEKINGISIDYCFPGEGDYEITLDIIDTIIGETYFAQSYYYLQILFEEQAYITSPDTLLIGESFELSAAETNLPYVEVNNYVWQISDGTAVTGEKINHKFSKEGVYRVELMVEGTQADSAYSTCVYKNVTCLKEIVLAATSDSDNALEDPSKVIKEDHSFEEVTDSSDVTYSIEVIRSKEKLSNDNFLFSLMETYGSVKIHYIEETQEYSYLVGEWDELAEAHPAWRELIQNGHKDAVVRSIDLNKVANFSLDNSFVLDQVRFDEAKWDIREDAIPDLENIAEIMLVFQDINLKVQAHTNSRGDADNNMTLSIQRAESVKGWLVSKGIDPLRIAASGAGETKPKYSNDTDEGLEGNRRVEFTFIK